MRFSPPPCFVFLLALALAVPALARDRDRGATLFTEEGFRGRAETFTYDAARLRGTRIGNDRARSLRVDRGCRVTLYEDAGFRGRHQTFDLDVPSLRRTRIGLDEVSSLRVDCRGGWSGDRWDDDDRWGGGGWHDDDYDWGWRTGAILYEHEDFRGRSLAIERDARNLDGTALGNDRASSVRVAPGCEVILYKDRDYRDTAVRLRHDEPDLGDTRLGNDEVSSVEVRCRGASGRPDRPGDLWDRDRGVILYEHENFEGRSLFVDRSLRRLDGTALGNDRASSIRVAPGCQVILYKDRHFRDTAVRLDYDEPDLGDTRLGNDEVSSLEVRCRGRR